MDKSNVTEGFLVVRVSTARGAIPLEDALVNIRGTGSDTSVIYSLTTDRDGRTQKVALATPSIAESEAPDGKAPYASYDVEVFKTGYTPVYFKNVPIFPSILSIQGAIMVPILEKDPTRPYSPDGNTIIVDENSRLEGGGGVL